MCRGVATACPLETEGLLAAFTSFAKACAFCFGEYLAYPANRNHSCATARDFHAVPLTSPVTKKPKQYLQVTSARITHEAQHRFKK